jgi:flagellar hook-associated protein FlgK
MSTLSALSGTSAAAVGLSGMRAAQSRLDSHAHNIANAQTPGFQRQLTTKTARPASGGVDAHIGQETQPSEPMSRLAEDLIGQRQSLYSFAANLRTVQAHDRMLGTLLDTRA